MPAETAQTIAGVAVDPLAGLQDLALPPPLPWLPPQGPGWVLLALALFGALAWSGWRWWQRYHRNRYRREALAQLVRVAAALDTPPAIAELSALLKRTALVAFPREAVATLHGEAWRAFLCTRGAPGFADPLCAPLFDAAYRARGGCNAEQRAALIGASRQWILAHRGDAPQAQRR